jgi:hypothetical protein
MAEVISVTQAIEMFRAARVTNLPRAMRLLGRNVAVDVIREAGSNLSNDLVHVRSGKLRRYVIKTLTDGIRDLPGGVETGLPKGNPLAVIAAVQDRGATIRPKTAKFLRIPLPPAFKGGSYRGVDQFANTPLREAKAMGFFAYRSKAGQLLIGRLVVSHNKAKQRAGQAYQIENWYVLKRQVTLPPRYWWRGAVMAVRGRLHQHVDAVMPQVVRP